MKPNLFVKQRNASSNTLVIRDFQTNI